MDFWQIYHTRACLLSLLHLYIFCLTIDLGTSSVITALNVLGPQLCLIVLGCWWNKNYPTNLWGSGIWFLAQNLLQNRPSFHISLPNTAISNMHCQTWLRFTRCTIFFVFQIQESSSTPSPVYHYVLLMMDSVILVVFSNSVISI